MSYLQPYVHTSPTSGAHYNATSNYFLTSFLFDSHNSMLEFNLNQD